MGYVRETPFEEGIQQFVTSDYLNCEGYEAFLGLQFRLEFNDYSSLKELEEDYLNSCIRIAECSTDYLLVAMRVKDLLTDFYKAAIRRIYSKSFTIEYKEEMLEA